MKTDRFQKNETLRKKMFASDIFFILFIIFAVIAMINPRWGMEYAPSEFRRGIDVILAIDVSRSMDIRDAHAPGAGGASGIGTNAIGTNAIGIGRAAIQSRLERGLLIAKYGIISAPGARYGVAIGRNRGYLAVPLTHDSEPSLVFLDSIDGSSLTGRSTNLESLIDTAAGSFISTSPARKVIVLVSDGESLTGIMRNAINRCIRENIIITAVAMGSDEGMQILSQGNDPDSQVVLSRRETAVMRSAAERTGGIYIDGSRDDAPRELSAHLLSITHDLNTERETGKKEPKQRRSLFIMLSIVSFTASKFATRQSGKKRTPKNNLQFVSLIAVLLTLTSCTEGRLLLIEANFLSSRGRYDEALNSYLKALNHEDAAPYAEYGIGLAFYLQDSGEAALQRYVDSQKMLNQFSDSEHRELRYRNHYNTGIIHFEEGNYQAAANSFKEALKTDPRRMDAKRNLELSVLSISMESGTNNRSEAQQEQREILFEYLKQDEQQLWKSREWAPEENITGPDY